VSNWERCVRLHSRRRRLLQWAAAAGLGLASVPA